MEGDKHKVILAGVGGSGVVWAGTLVARAGLKNYRYVTRLPNFTTAMRGGPCECMVILSNSEITCPLVAEGDALVMLESSQFKAFENRVREGGMIILESTGLNEVVAGKGAEILRVPSIEVAANIGDTLVSSMVLLGAYVGATDILPADSIERELETRFGVTETGIAAAEKQMVLTHNLEAFRRGLRIGEDYKRAKN